MAENTNTEREAVARAIWAVLRENEDRCDQELEDVPPTHHVWACADAARASLSLPAAGQEPVAWPTNAAEVREFIGVHMDSVRYHRDDAQPHEDDKYALSAHDLLSAFRWWAEDAAPPTAQAEGWISVEDARKPPPGKTVVLWVWAERYRKDDEGRQIAQDTSGLHLGEWRESENGNYFDNYSSTPFSDREAVLWWMDPAPPTSAEGVEHG